MLDLEGRMNKPSFFELKEELYQRPVGTINSRYVERCDAAHQFIIEKYTLQLTPLDYHIALCLLKNYRQPVPIEELVYGTFDEERDRRPLFKHISNLRKVLAPLLKVRIEYDRFHPQGGYILLPQHESWQEDVAYQRCEASFQDTRT
ncbi:MAG: helix-turn-helix domain-containing protein [Ktedonobacteraceae bacterium]|nr:helix-turn-helix domain-containing protein [Ktedonobacteraceae bacterium]